MAKHAKLIAGIRNNPKDVRLEDACKIAKWLGFVHKGKGGGSHFAYSRTGEPVGLNFQDIGGGKIPTYQAKQLIQMLDKYEEIARNNDEHT